VVACATRKKGRPCVRGTQRVEAPDKGFVDRVCHVGLVIAGLAVRQPWAVHLARIALMIGALEWLRTLMMIAAIRFSAGIPAWRMILILGTVAVLTLLAALVSQHRRLRGFYRLPGAGRNANRME